MKRVGDDLSLTFTLQVHMGEDKGDILVFLTGQDEIESMERLLRDQAMGLPPSKRGGGLRLMVVAIYASMPPEQQMKVSRRQLKLWPGSVSYGM